MESLLKRTNGLHEFFVFATDKGNLFEGLGYGCAKCGHELEVFYAENRLYAVRCMSCKAVQLVKAKSPYEACEKVSYGICLEFINRLKRR